MPEVKYIGKPCTGKPHARFDEGGQGELVPYRTQKTRSQMIQYDEIYIRNIGLFTVEEQQKLRDSVVAIAGVGGVGSYQAVALARCAQSSPLFWIRSLREPPQAVRRYYWFNC